MNLVQTPFKDLFIIKYDIPQDKRGYFFKAFHYDTFKKFGLETEFKENVFSFSQKNVIRGMHFQLSPYDQTRLVSVIKGRILDVVLDLRLGSSTFGKIYHRELFEGMGESLYIGRGFAHGFFTKEKSIVSYMITPTYNKDNDTGILWDSFGFNWGVKNPIISDKDKNFITLEEYLK